ncbi:Gfo/Idh/MocA family protein [Tenacibaculum sp. M341]|uniref:Gfo/Idh/MocA family protein n=1 Tax=Tenacibaculum sp. M341 TaxID=2530339 RepID=UPI001053DDF6|nr:Gfo/Idh/MocA family oxidoreductase [Tenacibaculum sp. M341]TCI91729.1 Gfo/Idh/MocA family oxidoreductase [Tenacibaculum sp. M341]
MKNFALFGVAGFVAPRHLEAIKETGNNLIASLDKSDSVGVLDHYFPESKFFLEYERFDRFIEKTKRREGLQLDYLSICTPNYLHDSHIRTALRLGANAICEKPLVLNPWNLEALEAIEKESVNSVNTILQLRLHPEIKKLKERVEKESVKEKYDVDLTYITSRGNWYSISWKGDDAKSGGVIANIGIHFFDMLGWVFGGLQDTYVHHRDDKTAAGYLEFEKARVRWFLSIDKDNLSSVIKNKTTKMYRSITINGEEIDFSKGFEKLHVKSYQEILQGNGFTLQDAKASIELMYKVRNEQIIDKREKHFLL